MCAASSSKSLGELNFAGGKGGLAAVNSATGAVIWKHPFETLDIGAATVANDVVFTSTYDGTSYALSTKNGDHDAGVCRQPQPRDSDPMILPRYSYLLAGLLPTHV